MSGFTAALATRAESGGVQEVPDSSAHLVIGRMIVRELDARLNRRLPVVEGAINFIVSIPRGQSGMSFSVAPAGSGNPVQHEVVANFYKELRDKTGCRTFVEKFAPGKQGKKIGSFRVLGENITAANVADMKAGLNTVLAEKIEVSAAGKEI